MDWLSFIGSILGGLIGGLFTFLGVKLTVKHEKEKEKADLLRKTNELKPRLEIVKCLDNTKNKKTLNKDCNVLLLNIEKIEDDKGKPRFFYNKDALDDNNLVYDEYEFKNNGLTEISEVCVSSNLPKNMAITELDNRKFYINGNLLNYMVWSNKRYIKPGEKLAIRIYYIKVQRITGLMSTPLTIWLHDINGEYWEQSFDYVKGCIEQSIYSSHNNFIERTDVNKAIECFRNPHLW